MNKKHILIGLAIVGLITWILAKHCITEITQTSMDHQQKAGPTVTAGHESGVSKTPSANDRSINPSVFYESKYGELPHALSGTRIGVHLYYDSNGNLLITPDIRNLFEYFFVASGQEPIETIIGRIQEYIRNMLPPNAQKETLEILDSYLIYEQKMYEIEQKMLPERRKDASRPSILSELYDILALRMETRRKYMRPEVVEAFFGAEEQYDLLTLDRLKIEEDSSLTAEEKIAKIEEVMQKYPDDVTRSYRTNMKRLELSEKAKALKERNATEEEIYELRRGYFGQDAAERMSKLDQERSEWNSRLKTYQRKKQALLKSSKLSDEEKQNRIEQLRNKSFSERELKRVDVILGGS